MQNQAILYGIIGVLAGSLLTIFVASNAVNNKNQQMMGMMGMRTQNMMEETEEMIEEKDEMHKVGMDMSMNEMTESLKEKTGDAFDKAFINAMIDHHQGAIDMANLAVENAKHDEIKTLANDIISAQTNEIEMMKEWQTAWGY